MEEFNIIISIIAILIVVLIVFIYTTRYDMIIGHIRFILKEHDIEISYKDLKFHLKTYCNGITHEKLDQILYSLDNEKTFIKYIKKITRKMIWIYDIEVAPNLLLVVCKEKISKKLETFTLFKGENKKYDEREQLKDFLDKYPKLVGFNNHNYDDVILQRFLESYNETLETLLYSIKEYSNIIIHEKQYRPRYKNSIDLFRIHHFNNKARSMSLKACAAKLHFDNVQDLAFDPNKPIKDDDLFDVISYCINDVEATESLYEATRDDLDLRKYISKSYGINVMSDNSVTIGEKIFLEKLSSQSHISKSILKKLRTERKLIDLSELVPEYIHFNSKELNEVKNQYLNTILTLDSNFKVQFKIRKKLDYLTFDFGLGGLHATKMNKSGSKTIKESFVSNNDYVVALFDFSSFYPNIAVNNNIYPEHLSTDFCTVYKDIYNKRAEAKYNKSKYKKGSPQYTAYDLQDTVLKLSLNGCFGRMKEKHSFLFDPKALYNVTIIGQFILASMTEKLMNISTVIQSNTDGIYVYIHKDNIKKGEALCKEFEQLTNIKVDIEYWDWIHMSDVNNYIAKMDNGYIKCKGRYEVDKDIHKMYQAGKIVPLAIKKYYDENIPIEETIKNHNDFKDFIIFNRQKGNNKLYYLDGNFERKYLPKTNRFLVTNNGKRIVKHYEDRRIEVYKVGYKLTEINKLPKTINFEDIDYNFYINEAKKLLIKEETNQLSLF